MELRLLYKNSRSAVIEIVGEDIFHTAAEYTMSINGSNYETCNRVVKSVYGLKPGTAYVITVEMGMERSHLSFRTDDEFVTLNVKDFGAKGDGIQDDTHFIQAAIMACPKDSRVLIPEGTYRITSLFLKNCLKLELAKGAVLLALTNRANFPIFPGLIKGCDEEKEYHLGTWEGHPLPMFTAIITGVSVHDVEIYGQGVIDGNAGFDNWWHDPKTMHTAFRPRMIFLNQCENIVVQGITVQNSPSWNIHPYFSNHLKFFDLSVISPKDSPNTDGLNPESCHHVEIIGAYFSVGDDCIAVKAGKIYMGKRYKVATENVMIRQCCMQDGHGAVTLGSEMAAGIRNLTVRDCLFLYTDRGLRVKTRRGRGKDAVIDSIIFDNIRMDHVLTPFVVNCFYFCDPDGKSDYVRSKEPLPVDEQTPEIRSLCFRNIDAKNCHVSAAFFYGLPEQKIKRIEMEQVKISFAKDVRAAVPAMMDDVEPVCRQGIFANNIEVLILNHVQVDGCEGKELLQDHVELLKIDGKIMGQGEGNC